MTTFILAAQPIYQDGSIGDPYTEIAFDQNGENSPADVLDFLVSASHEIGRESHGATCDAIDLTLTAREAA